LTPDKIAARTPRRTTVAMPTTKRWDEAIEEKHKGTERATN
jgi:hypothetical protein